MGELIDFQLYIKEGMIKMSVKDQLWDELKIKSFLCVKGVGITDKANEELKSRLGKDLLEFVYDLYLNQYNEAPLIPQEFLTPSGLIVPFKYEKDAKYKVDLDGDKYILVDGNGNKVFDVKLPERPEYYKGIASDGKELRTIAKLICGDTMGVCYSNECAYKDKGLDCLFCSINKGNREVFWKNPKQIAEAVAAAYNEGVVKKIHFTGGVVPERRELDYYIDTMEAIDDALPEGHDAVAIAECAAPSDLEYLDRLKEQGFKSVSMNLEIWDKNIYKTICPGKSSREGGWEHWVEALEYAANVFGRGYSSSNFVIGIEPATLTLDGTKYLSEKGVTVSYSYLQPKAGTAFEGMTTPDTLWYVDMCHKLVEIQKKNGIGYKQVYETTARKDDIANDIYRIEEELLPVFGCNEYEPKKSIYGGN